MSQQRDLNHKLHKLDSKSYVVPAGEERHYHCRIEQEKFDGDTGARLSVPRIQKFGKKTFKKAAGHLKRLGFTVDVLHDPLDWERANAERLAEEKATKQAELAKTREQEVDDKVKSKLAELGIPEGKTIDEIIAEKIQATQPAPAKEPAKDPKQPEKEVKDPAPAKEVVKE